MTLFSLSGNVFWVTIAAGVRKYPCQITDARRNTPGAVVVSYTGPCDCVTNYYWALFSG